MTDKPSSDVAQKRATLLAKLADASARPPTLVAASKRQSDERIDAALAAGHRVFGENRVQEAQSRWAERRTQYPDLELRLIGPLQTNKAEDAVTLFDVIETVDRPKLARALAKACEKLDRRPELLIQVNTGDEPQKAGVSVTELSALIQLCRQELALPVIGLMCIPPADEPAGPHFAFLAKLADRHGLQQRSMGMSGDFETAAGFGATHVRVGTAFFGEREH